MSESALKFGPEWLRNLSQGTNVSSPPPSPGLGLHAPKFKMAEFRYGREEMLAIFPKDIKMPPDLKQFTGMHKEQYQLPVTLVALTEEEQKIWTRSVNSDAVLRLMGKGTSGTPTGAPVPRGGRGGGSVDRGRGRGRATYFQRGPSLEDGGENAPPGIFTRQRSYERPNSLAERGVGWEERERRYEKSFASREEESGVTGRKETMRGNLDWRSSNQRDRDRDGEDDGGWRVSGLRSEKWGRAGWRSERSERGEHDDAPSEWPSNGKVTPRKSNTSRAWNDDHPGGDVLPEWSTEDNRVAESVGTFDATGAFMETKDDEKKVKLKEVADNVNTNQNTPHEIQKSHSTSPSPGSPPAVEAPQQPSPEPKNTSSPSQSQHDVTKLDRSKESDVVKVIPENFNNEEPEVNPNSVFCRKKSSSPIHKKEEINFEHLEKAAESLVDTWTAEEDEKVDASNISNSSLSQWFYRDPQGIVQGPFSDSEMAEWFRTGYFNMSLLVRRGLDGRFCPLGELVKQWGCVPFLSSSVPIVVQPSPPAPVQHPQLPQSLPSVQASVLNDLLGPTAMQMEHQNDITSDHDQQLRLLQQQLLQQQLIQQQHLFQQQQQQMFIRQQLQQVLGGLKPTDGFSQLSSQQQQQQQFFLLQRVLAQQQQHPPGVVPRPATENNSMSDPVRQFMAQLAATQSASSKDDSQSLWNIQARTPRAEVGGRWTGIHNQQASVWDLDTSAVPPRETALGPSHMLPEILEQEKKLLDEQQKKRLNEEEMLRKQEEERRRRQLEDEERIREEIRQREEEEERIRMEELRRQQREIEERKQKEAEERKLKEQELRRLQEEEKRRQEEREKEELRQQELFQRQEEERLRQQREFLQQEEQRKRDEYRRQEEEKQRLEEEKLKLEHQRELQRQLKLQQQEALKRLQKQQKSKPQAPAWGGQTIKQSDNSLSLAEIQKLQEEKERQERIEWEMQQHLIQQQIQQQQQQAAQQAKTVNLTWANQTNSAGGPVKSLLEIQQEEADKLAQEQEKEQQVKKQQQQANNVSLATAGVWSNANNHLLRANSSPSPWNFENSVSNSHGSGFWDDSVTIVNGSKTQMPLPNKAQDQRCTALSNNTMANGNGQIGKSRMIRARKEEETVMKLFEGHTQNVDEFTKWCNQTLRSMQSTIDVPTFVGFLKDVESPYEVYDYVRVYLGESKEAHNFAKQFLEKRSKYRNQDHKKEENMWGPAPAITPSLSKLQPSELEGPKVAGAKRKKKRMQKLDNTILGFTVHASMDRVNVGDIDHGEDI